MTTTAGMTLNHVIIDIGNKEFSPGNIGVLQSGNHFLTRPHLHGHVESTNTGQPRIFTDANLGQVTGPLRTITRPLCRIRRPFRSKRFKQCREEEFNKRLMADMQVGTVSIQGMCIRPDAAHPTRLQL